MSEFNNGHRTKIELAMNNVRRIMTQFKQEELGNRLSNFSLSAFELVIKQELDAIIKTLDEVEQCPNTPPEQSA